MKVDVDKETKWYGIGKVETMLVCSKETSWTYSEERWVQHKETMCVAQRGELCVWGVFQVPQVGSW